MRTYLLTLLSISILAAAPLASGSEPSLPQRYLEIYNKIDEGEHLEKSGDFKGSLNAFEDSYAKLVEIHNSDPRWESALVLHRLDDIEKKIIELEQKTNTAPSVNSGFLQTKFTNLPHTSYPWKKDILTTMFWIGEGSTPTNSTANVRSAWDEGWQQKNHGPDSPYNRNGYAAGDHASTLNPFYVALPFNDLAFPEQARKWVPKDWMQNDKDGKPTSACQHRWIWIENNVGRSCYAQWEDVGPETNNNPEYVFGSNEPGPGLAGLCVSPAVAQFLSLNGTAKVSWRFVNDEDVRPGPWLLLDEQAVLFSALHESKKTVH